MLQTDIEIKPEIINQTNDLIAKANSLQIIDHNDYELATMLNKMAKQAKSAIEDFFKPMKDRAFAAHKEICKKEKDQIDPLDQVVRKVNAEMNVYDRKIEAEARRVKAETEARLRKEHEDRQLKEAIALEESGKTKLAEKVLNTPISVNVQVEKPDMRVNDTKVRLNWRFKIVDAALVPREYLVPCEKQIGARVKSSQGQCVIPGVEVYSEKSFY